MPATDYYHQSHSLPLPKFGRSILSTSRHQMHSMEPTHEPTSLELELESFEMHVVDQFHGLSEPGSSSTNSGVRISICLNKSQNPSYLEAFITWAVEKGRAMAPLSPGLINGGDKRGICGFGNLFLKPLLQLMYPWVLYHHRRRHGLVDSGTSYSDGEVDTPTDALAGVRNIRL